MSAEELVEESAWRWSGWSSRLIGGFCRHLAFGQLLIRFPDGSASLHRGRFGGASGALEIRSPLQMAARLLTRGEVGFGESYVEGHWTTPDLASLLEVLYDNMEHLGAGPRGMRWSRLWDRLAHRLRDNHPTNSRRNIAHHYDLGNEFYRLWLDPSMTYSSALFADPARDNMETAQERKYQRLLDKLNAAPGDHILEIGCGWGGFAELAARRGLRVTGVTLSREQLAYGRRRLAAAGLAGQVDLRLQDYRDIEGHFDHAVSIEMMEAVGEAFWPTYYQTLRRVVRPGGRIALQVITMNEDDFPIYRKQPDFVQLYIFPGGMLPTPERMIREAQDADLLIRETAWFGRDYAETLRRWRLAFRAAGEEIARLGYGARFRRMWDYYLAYCETGFKTGCIDLTQTVLEVPVR
ncbi:MAG: cyclopropane-fatty-acyl-phospholipid synthase family protein [Thiocapsa sp.]|jgi:cyclopropane-fatty-acyl-phospholipid synthase|nr:cyclopropane-fatty-acyl-phospholipid synthase family protein [Thiocapsa sp.]MCG6897521.1 cyclopropane-fatty-acyl-phospholipid synthase family protein [Thiocapsa sp.]MCG6985445.1 cyclopropane-fatty-acyl-phospholipid synthase family protein [Thiocapsa sp.]